MTFDSDVTSHSALTLDPAVGRSTTGLAGHSLHQPGGGSGSDRLTRPKPEDRQTATCTVAREGQNTEYPVGELLTCCTSFGVTTT